MTCSASVKNFKLWQGDSTEQGKYSSLCVGVPVTSVCLCMKDKNSSWHASYWIEKWYKGLESAYEGVRPFLRACRSTFFSSFLRLKHILRSFPSVLTVSGSDNWVFSRLNVQKKSKMSFKCPHLCYFFRRTFATPAYVIFLAAVANVGRMLSWEI